MSFFAFTATPKGKTLEIFGEPQPDGSFHPFHIYSMRQAIEGGFYPGCFSELHHIQNVLSNRKECPGQSGSPYLQGC